MEAEVRPVRPGTSVPALYGNGKDEVIEDEEKCPGWKNGAVLFIPCLLFAQVQQQLCVISNTTETV
jgi:hypothetical protein